MALTQAEVLEIFDQVSAIKNSDQVLIITANQNGTVSATKITAELMRAYFMTGFEIGVSNDGYLVIGGTKTEHRIAGITPLLQRGDYGIQCSNDNGATWNYIAFFNDFTKENIILQTNDTVTILPNVLNVWQNDVSDLTISLGEGEEGVVNEYKLQFQCGSTPTNLHLPVAVRWMNDEPLECEPNYIYQVSILDNLATGGGWPKVTTT